MKVVNVNEGADDAHTNRRDHGLRRAKHPELHDPRLDALRDYDRQHDAPLRVGAQAYLATCGDVRSAAN